MRLRFQSAMGLLGLFIVVPVFAAPQDSYPAIFEEAKMSNIPSPAPTISEIEISGLHHIPAESVKARLSFHTATCMTQRESPRMSAR